MNGIRIGDLPFLDALTDDLLKPVEKKNKAFSEAFDALMNSAENNESEQEATKLQKPLVDIAQEETVKEKLETCPECHEDKPDVENRTAIGRVMCKDCYNKLIKDIRNADIGPSEIVHTLSPTMIGRLYER